MDPTLLQSCLSESYGRDILQRLAAALPLLERNEQEDAALLLAYIARQLLEADLSPAQQGELLDPVLQAYRSIDGPRLWSAAGQLISYAYYIRSGRDKQGVSVQLAAEIDQELAAGPAPHVLGPLLQATETARLTSPVVAAMDPEDPRSPKRQIERMQQAVERAIPVAIDLGLQALGDSGNSYRQTDALYLLQHAFLAGPKSSPELLAAAPRVLDALAQLDPRPVERSGLPRRPLETLLAQTESRLRAAGALNAAGVPEGGQTAPADLRRRFGIPPMPPGTFRIESGGNTYLLREESR